MVITFWIWLAKKIQITNKYQMRSSKWLSQQNELTEYIYVKRRKFTGRNVYTLINKKFLQKLLKPPHLSHACIEVGVKPNIMMNLLKIFTEHFTKAYMSLAIINICDLKSHQHLTCPIRKFWSQILTQINY